MQQKHGNPIVGDKMVEPEQQRHALESAPAIADRLAAIERVLRSTSVGAFLILIAWLLRDVLLLGFAAVLIACVLRGIAEFLHRRSGVDPNWTLAFVIVAIAISVAGLIWLRGPEIMSQAEQLVDRLTAQVDHLWRLVSDGAWGTRISESLRHTLRSGTDALPGLATGVVASTLGIGGSLLVVIVAGLFLAASPHVYITGALRLLPPPWRHRGRDVLCELGKTLRLWCLGQFIDMSVVTLLVGAGLFTLGVPLTPTLALFAGLLNFVPYVGALVGAVPAILVAMAHSSTLALWVALLFVAVQTIEGNLIAPFVQKRAGTLPPAMTIASQTILGTLFGVLGLILATPFMAAFLAAVRMIYVESVLEDGVAGLSRDRESDKPPDD